MLTDMYKEPEKQIEEFEEAAPIKTIGKERHIFGGNPLGAWGYGS